MKQLSWARGGGAPAAVPVEHTAVCLQRERSRSTRAGLLPRARAPHPLIHTTNCTFALYLSLVPPPTPCNPFNSLSLPIFRLLSRSPPMFLHGGKNKPPYSNARRSNLLQWEGRTHSSWHAIVNLAALENVYLDFQCHTFLGCCFFSLFHSRMVPLCGRVQCSAHFPGPSASLSCKRFIISRHERNGSYLGPRKVHVTIITLVLICLNPSEMCF